MGDENDHGKHAELSNRTRRKNGHDTKDGITGHNFECVRCTRFTESKSYTLLDWEGDRCGNNLINLWVLS